MDKKKKALKKKRGTKKKYPHTFVFIDGVMLGWVESGIKFE